MTRFNFRVRYGEGRRPEYSAWSDDPMIQQSLEARLRSLYRKLYGG